TICSTSHLRGYKNDAYEFRGTPFLPLKSHVERHRCPRGILTTRSPKLIGARLLVRLVALELRHAFQRIFCSTAKMWSGNHLLFVAEVGWVAGRLAGAPAPDPVVP